MIGYEVEATDGIVGRISRSSCDADGGWLVVRSSRWRLGGERALATAQVLAVDHGRRTVIVDCYMDEVHDAPAFRADSLT